MNVITLLILTLSLPAFAAGPAGESPWAAFESLRQGIAPTAADSDLNHTKKEMLNVSQKFGRTLTTQTTSKTRECVRFVKLTLQTVEDIKNTLPKLTSVDRENAEPNNVLARSRLQLTVPSFKILHRMFTAGRDGGYGTIDLRATQTCAFRDRALVQREFDQAAKAYADFQAAALGSPGLLSLERLLDRQLELADQQQTSYDRWSWALLGGTLVTSVILFQVSTPIIAATFGVGTKAARVAAVAAALGENVAYIAVDRVTNPEPEQRERAVIPSWDENMRDVETLVGSHFNEPQLYLAYTSAIQARLAGMIGEWVQLNQNALAKAVGQ